MRSEDSSSDPAALVTRWRARADEIEKYVEGGGRPLRACANELEATLRTAADEPLTLSEAARRSGYSPDHIARLVRGGKIPNAGRRGAPRVRAGTLPLRPKPRRVASTAGTPYDPVADARSLLGRQGER